VPIAIHRFYFQTFIVQIVFTHFRHGLLDLDSGGAKWAFQQNEDEEVPLRFLTMIALWLSVCHPAIADLITLTHVQTSAAKELIGTAPRSDDLQTDMVTATITNSTGRTWLDYEFFISSPTNEGLEIFYRFTAPAGPFEAASRSRDLHMLRYSNGSLPAGQSFEAMFTVRYLRTSIEISGRPSFTVPESTELPLMLLGLCVVGVYVRRPCDSLTYKNRSLTPSRASRAT
jgi:hypothetical protein